MERNGIINALKSAVDMGEDDMRVKICELIADLCFDEVREYGISRL